MASNLRDENWAAPRTGFGDHVAADEARAKLGDTSVPPLQPSPERLCDVVVQTLIGGGVQQIFGVPGGAVSPIYDALVLAGGPEVVTMRHETTAVFAAMGHARIAGGLPLVLVTSGPGITNMLTGLASAHASGTPCLIIAGDVATRSAGRGALQDSGPTGIDAVAMLRPITRDVVRLEEPELVVEQIVEAMAVARRGGPVCLVLPIDVALAPAVGVRRLVAATPANSSVASSAAELDSLAADLLAAPTTLMVLGSGARHPATIGAAVDLAEALQCPVATSPRAKGVFPEDHPLSVGVLGHGGHASAHEQLAGLVDTLLLVGCGLREASTNAWTLPFCARHSVAQIDIDPKNIGRNYAIDRAIVAPAEVVLPLLAGRIDAAGLSPRARRRFGVRRWSRALDSGSPHELAVPWVMRRLTRGSPRNAVFATDIGEHLLFALHFLAIGRTQAFLCDTAYGSMGSGIGMAVGAAMADPERPVVVFCGDYGFQMFGVELATCVEHRLNIVFAVLNDARMGMVENGFTRVYGREQSFHGPRVDFARVAAAHGARGYTVARAEDFDAADTWLWHTSGPVLLDIHTDRRTQYPVSARNMALRQAGESVKPIASPGFEIDGVADSGGA